MRKFTLTILTAITFAVGLSLTTPAQESIGRFTRLLLNSACEVRTGTGSPESAVTGDVCDVYLRTNGGTATTVYIKESGTATSTGWAAIATGLTPSNVALLNGTNTFTAANTFTVPNLLFTVGDGSDAPFGGSAASRSLYVTRNGRTDVYIRDSTNDIEGIISSGATAGTVVVGSSTNHPLALRTNSTDWITLSTAGVTTFGNDISVPPAREIYLDGGGDTFISETAPNQVDLDVGGATRMRWTTTAAHLGTGIKFGIGTSPTHVLDATNSTGGIQAAQFTMSHSSNPFGVYVLYSAAAPNINGNSFYRGDDSGGVRFDAMSNGGIRNYTANDVNLSDARAKVISGQAPPVRADLRRLQFVKGKYLDSKRSTEDIMVTAQQVEQVFPDLVEVFDDVRGLKGVREQQLFMRGLQAINELDAQAVAQEGQIADLQQRVAQLESQTRTQQVAQPLTFALMLAGGIWASRRRFV